MVALFFLKKHWGKLIAVLFIAAWAATTYGLYDDNKDLSMALGGAESAVSVCIADRVNMDNELILLKADIALIQADNDQYKNDIENAKIVIAGLNTDISGILEGIDEEVIPENCEAAVDWMLEKALAR